MKFTLRKNTLILSCILLNLIIFSLYIPQDLHKESKKIHDTTDLILVLDLTNETSIDLTDPTNFNNSNEILESNRVSFEGLTPSEDNITIKCNQNTFHGKLETVIGDDDRLRITPTTSYPWRTIVKLYITWSSDTYIGSGALIDENHVLTAGHCVYSHTRGGWADSIKVVPGADNGGEPYGHAWALDMRTYGAWIDNVHYQHDFAVITLDSDIGLQTGWMGLKTADPSDPIYTGGLNVAGYPGDLDYGMNLYWDYDVGRTATEYNHWYYMDTEGGMSGSPVWMYDGSDGSILSVHAYSDDGSGSNHGTRIDKNKFDCINNWLTADATGTDKPDLADRGENYCGFNTTAVGAGLTDFEVWCDVQNLGTYPLIMDTISYYASNDTIITEEDYLIGVDEIGSIFSTYSKDSSWTGKFPNGMPSGTYYIGWILDADDTIDEFNENNNVNYIKDTQLLVDATPPSNPIICNQLNGTTENNVWQDVVNDPCFNWSGASDSHTNVAGYYYYWGTNPNGVSSNFISSPQYDPPKIGTGKYYLRVKTEDTVGNNASWTMLYTFNYNETLNEDDNEYDPKEDLRDNTGDSSVINSGDDLNLDDLLFDISGNEIHVVIWITCGILAIFIHFYFRGKRLKM